MYNEFDAPLVRDTVGQVSVIDVQTESDPKPAAEEEDYDQRVDHTERLQVSAELPAGYAVPLDEFVLAHGSQDGNVTAGHEEAEPEEEDGEHVESDALCDMVRAADTLQDCDNDSDDDCH